MIGDKQGEIILADAIPRWSQDPQTLAQMGVRPPKLEEKFTKAQAIARWTELIDQLAAASK